MLRHCLKGAMLGTVITFGYGTIVLALILWLCYLEVGNFYPSDGYLIFFFKALPQLALLSAIIGVPAGIAAKLPLRGVRLLWSVGFVAIFTILGSGLLLRQIHPPLKGDSDPSFLLKFSLCFLMANISSLIVLICGLSKDGGRLSSSYKEETNENTPPDTPYSE